MLPVIRNFNKKTILIKCSFNPICHPTLMIKKSIIENIGGYHGPLHCEDYDYYFLIKFKNILYF